jgi:hypothetical protein
MNRRGDEEGSFLAVSFMTTAWIPGTGGTHELPWTAPNGVSTKQNWWDGTPSGVRAGHH